MLKLTQWFLRGRFRNIVIEFSLFSTFEKDVRVHFHKLESPFQKGALC